MNDKLCGVCKKSSRLCGEKKNGSKGGFPWGDLDQDSVIQDHSDGGAWWLVGVWWSVFCDGFCSTLE